jgi:hypothetical protein
VPGAFTFIPRKNKMRITITTISPVLNALRVAGFKPKLVGSLAVRGWSDHDADLLIHFKAPGEVEDPMDWPAYKRYIKLMQKLGYKMKGQSNDYDEWHKGQIIIDIVPVAED